jgi:hypothetical protein
MGQEGEYVIFVLVLLEFAKLRQSLSEGHAPQLSPLDLVHG